MLRLLRSAGVRLAVFYAILFGNSALLLIVAIYLSTMSVLSSQVDLAIEADGKNLLQQLQQGGTTALSAAIYDRLAVNTETAVYLLLDRDGQTLAGNLPGWPDAVPRTETVAEIPVPWEGGNALVRLHRFQSQGMVLLVGRNVEMRAALRSVLTRTLSWGLALIVLLSVVGAMLVRLMVHRMLANVSATAGAIAAGDLSRRVVRNNRDDEFDQLAVTINTMLDRIGRLMDGVRQVSNAIAHDLRTPITRARARLEDAAAHAISVGQLQGAIGRAVSDLDGVTAVFQALLRISEIEAGARRFAFTTMDAGPLLADLADLYGAVAEESGLQLALDAARPMPVRGDRELLQQAVANLLDNAVKFSPPGGTISLCGEAVAEGVRISVTDHGPGIPPADLPRATDRFYRGETARSTPGFGLGLTLVGAVAQLHGGTLQLKDAGPGLRAILTVPFTDLAAAE